MIRLLLADARCLITGHVWGDWSAWSEDGRYRVRDCARCERPGVEYGI
jgi:hypothetical protein